MSGFLVCCLPLFLFSVGIVGVLFAVVFSDCLDLYGVACCCSFRMYGILACCLLLFLASRSDLSMGLTRTD